MLVDMKIHYQSCKFLYSPSYVPFDLGATEPLAYCIWDVACTQALRNITLRKFLPLCTFLNTGSLEHGSMAFNTVHLLHMERPFATLFILGWKRRAVLDHEMQQLSRLPTPLTAHQDICLVQAPALCCLLLDFIPALFTLRLFIRECNWSEQRCTPTLGVTILEYALHILANLLATRTGT